MSKYIIAGTNENVIPSSRLIDSVSGVPGVLNFINGKPGNVLFV